MDVLKVFLLRFERLHACIENRVLRELGEEQMQPSPALPYELYYLTALAHGPRARWRLRVHAQMSTGPLPGHLEAPSEHKPLEDLHRLRRQNRTQQGLGLELALRIVHEDPSDRQGRHARVMPDRRMRDELDHPLALTIPPAHSLVSAQCKHRPSRGAPERKLFIRGCRRSWTRHKARWPI
jgi:hypothetical protein